LATNKHALIRYKTLDKCLQNRTKRWTLQDLMDACSDALYEFEGKDTYVSKRTTQLDIQVMRSDKLGYNAPIIVYERKYYTYADDDFTITDIPLTANDMDVLSESVEMLRQFKDFSLFTELNGVIQKLEDKIHRTGNQAPIIHIEKNENLKGLEHLDTLYQAILKQIVLKLTYRSFKARTASSFLFHGYILKEYNNRWFVVGRREDHDKIYVFALDRIEKIEMSLSTSYKTVDFDADSYYKDTIGVTVNNRIIEVEFWADALNAPYIKTKPLHHSQEIVEERDDKSTVFRMRVSHNFELERLLISFADALEVLKPSHLRKIMIKKLKKAVENYEK